MFLPPPHSCTLVCRGLAAWPVGREAAKSSAGWASPQCSASWSCWTESWLVSPAHTRFFEWAWVIRRLTGDSTKAWVRCHLVVYLHSSPAAMQDHSEEGSLPLCQRSCNEHRCCQLPKTSLQQHYYKAPEQPL